MSLFYVGHPNDHDLALFAGGELGPVARWRIEKHLQNCSRCEEAVADFFHLQSELGELSELPNVDWSAQAQMILDRAERSQATNAKTPAPSLGHPWALRAGLAMATVICAIVIMRQLPLQKTEPELVSQTALSRSMPEQVANLSSSKEDVGREQAGETRTSAEPAAEAPARDEADFAGNQQALGTAAGAGERSRSDATEEFASARRENELAPDLPAPSAPAGLRTAPVAPPPPPATLAYRSAPQVAEDKRGAAPAEALVANQVVGGAQNTLAENAPRLTTQTAIAEATGNEIALADRADRQVPVQEQAKEKTELQAAGRGSAAQKAQAPVRIATARASGGGVGGFANVAPVAQAAPATRYSIVPVGPGSQVETGVAADGAISFRTIDAATGTITITHVYAQ